MKLLLKPRTFKFSFRYTNFRQYDGKTNLYQANELVLPRATFILDFADFTIKDYTLDAIQDQLSEIREVSLVD